MASNCCTEILHPYCIINLTLH